MNATFYNESSVGNTYQSNMALAMAEGERARREKRLAPLDEENGILLIVIDNQVDFVHQEGALAVPGAVDDMKRLIPWMIDRTEDGTLVDVMASLDSHVPIQIFHPIWWMNPKTGQSPDPFTQITSESLLRGEWVPRVTGSDSNKDLKAASINYVEKLEKQSKKVLMIWPYHTIVGSHGHMLVPALTDAIAYHAGARGRQPTFIHKGMIPTSEHYSIWEPEVEVPDHEQGGLNTVLLDLIPLYSKIFFTGQAKSHCVLESVASMMRYFANQPEVIAKFHFLMDTTSSVVSPGIDFDALADAQFAEYERLGARLVTTKTWDRYL